jgi:hypothetical protein
MLAEVTLTITKTEATLVLTSSEKVLEQELWILPKQMQTDVAKIAGRMAFDEIYDWMQYLVYPPE